MKPRLILLYLLGIIALTACDKQPTDLLNSPKIYTYCHKLSAVSADKEGYWIGDENGDIWLVKDLKRQQYRTGLDKIYDVLRDKSDSTQLWIASRNNGLQKWQLQGDSLTLCRTYTIQDKGNHYSPYDLEMVQGHLYVATSQGLFMVPNVDTCHTLRPIYPQKQTSYRHAAPIHHLAVIGNRYIYAKTQEGLLCYDTSSQKSKNLHLDMEFSNVYSSRDTLYVTMGNKLVSLNGIGEKQNEYQLNFKVLNFCQYGKTHIFLTPSSAYLTNDMQHFKKISLWDEMNAQAYNTILPEDGLGYYVVIAGANEQRLPHHFDAVGNGSNTQFVTYSGKNIYITNKSGQIYACTPKSTNAQEVFQLKNEQIPVALAAINNTLYFVSVTNQLCSLKLQDSFWANQIMSSPKELLKIGTHVTAITALPSQNKVLIGIQDELLHLDVTTNKIDTIKSMHGKYITSFYTVPETNDTYISTLNDGVFYYSAGEIHKIESLGDMSFVNAVAVSKGYNPQMYLLDNHKLMSQKGNHVDAQGHRRMLLPNDSLLVTVPEQGIRTYHLNSGKIQKRALLYSDIRFEPSACISTKKKIFLGSNLGVAVVSLGQKQSMKWIDFEEHTISIWTILYSIFGLFLMLSIYYVVKRRKRLGESHQLRLQVEDLQKRFSGLNLIVDELSKTEAERVRLFEQKLLKVDINNANWKTESQHLAQLSSELARLNQDVVLQIIKALKKQLDYIKSLNYAEGALLVEDSEKVLDSGEVEHIIAQYGTNKTWLNRVTEFKARMQSFEAAFQDTLILNGVNDELVASISHWKDILHQKTIDEMEHYLHEQIAIHDKFCSEETFALIVNYFDKRERFLQKQKTYAHMASILSRQMAELRQNATDMDRATLLRKLRPLEIRMQQINILHRLRKLMRAYSEEEDTSKENVEHILQLIDSFYEVTQKIDCEIWNDILRFTSSCNQQVKVLVLLLADKNVKRTLIPGMLGIYGNLNPVISRLYHGKIGENLEVLRNYQQQHPESIAFYLLQLIES